MMLDPNTASTSNAAPLLEGMGLFEMEKRPVRDQAWAYAYFISIALVLAGGVYGMLCKSAFYTILEDPSYLDDPSHCPGPANLPASGGLLGHLVPGAISLVMDPEGDVTNFFNYLRNAGILLLVSIAAALLLAFLFLYLLQQHPSNFVIFTVLVQVGVPALAGLHFMHSGHQTLATLSLASSAGLAVYFYLAKDSLVHMSRLLGLSARALRSNSSIITAVLLTNMAIVLLSGVLSSAGVLAAKSGHIVPTPGRIPIPGHSGCRDSDGDSVRCCMWQTEGWVRGYAALLSVVTLWSWLLISQVKVYIVSGATAQWYFSPFGVPTNGAVWKSLSHALGPSFGSLCLSSWVLTVVAYLRGLLERARSNRELDQGSGSLFGLFFKGILSCLLTLTDKLTKFATVRMSLSGQSFFTSGLEVVELLRRNMMDAYAVWWLPGVVLRVSSALLSALYGYLIFLFTTRVLSPAPSYSVCMTLAWISAIASFLLLLFLVSILLNMVDATFVCYALDRDREMCSQVEVHQVYIVLPSAGGPGPAKEWPARQGQLPAHWTPPGGSPGPPMDAGYYAAPQVHQNPGGGFAPQGGYEPLGGYAPQVPGQQPHPPSYASGPTMGEGSFTYPLHQPYQNQAYVPYPSPGPMQQYGGPQPQFGMQAQPEPGRYPVIQPGYSPEQGGKSTPSAPPGPQ